MADDQMRPPPLPPREPYPPAPSVASAQQVSEIGKLVVRKLDDHAARVDSRLNAFHQELALVRQQGASNNSTNDTMPSPAPDSLPKAIAGHTVSVAKWGTLAIGVLGIAAQVAKVWRPSLVAPLDQLLDLVKQVLPGVAP
jgi:hypothetical protein